MARNSLLLSALACWILPGVLGLTRNTLTIEYSAGWRGEVEGEKRGFAKDHGVTQDQFYASVVDIDGKKIKDDEEPAADRFPMKLIMTLKQSKKAQDQRREGPPAPSCAAFSCGKGKYTVGKTETRIISYGCKDDKQTGYDLNKCCVERDICKQTCGMTYQACDDAFQKCSRKICKGDMGCELQASMSQISNDPFEGEMLDNKQAQLEKPSQKMCKGYNNAQAAACQCVSKDKVAEANLNKLKQFYKNHNPEKLDANGDIKNVAEVKQKWKGKLPSMFVALASKYSDAVVTMESKPSRGAKPPPGQTPPKSSQVPREQRHSSPSPVVEEADPEFEEFQKTLRDLEAKKAKAKDDEDYDSAIRHRDTLRDLKAKELARWKVEKAEAAEAEDFDRAKLLKGRIARLEL